MLRVNAVRGLSEAALLTYWETMADSQCEYYDSASKDALAISVPAEAWTGGWMSHAELLALWILTGNLNWRAVLHRSVESRILGVIAPSIFVAYIPVVSPSRPSVWSCSSTTTSDPRRPCAGGNVKHCYGNISNFQITAPDTSTSTTRTSAAITREAATVLTGALRGGVARHAGALAAFGVEATVFARE